MSTPVMQTGNIVMGVANLDRLMPMHLLVDARGLIRHVGPTLAKVLPLPDMVGQSFLRAFALRRPRKIRSITDVRENEGVKIHVRLHDEHATQLVGTAVCLPGEGMVLLNLSFGISVVEAVARYGLAGSDFPATDLTLELLYLVESKSAAQAASGQLSTKLRGEKDAAVARAGSDMLTGLANRLSLNEVLHRLISRRMPFALVHLDLDHFKAVNDTLGHAAGDHVLQEVSRILLEETRADDTVARVGGDEFVLVFPGLTERALLLTIAQRMIFRLEQPFDFRGEPCRISASIGMVESTLYARPVAEQMLEDADIALYASKYGGRAQATFFEKAMAGGEGHAAGREDVILSDLADGNEAAV
ncbi:diguanylate cyclase [Aliiroseovarius sp.]|uniref:diguanylate cyclase domain-containing protein n=1 Tax=Aliiroseovarius sp. TaxID=1872442 RepID=UPI00260C2E1A|nr:diguanylate cyclase [Aliiroseovarius sp.]